jgi:hypothetical protein
MKKTITLLLLLIACLQIDVFCQNLSELGQDNSAAVNQEEASYLNKSLESQKADFNFTGKKVLFAEGNNASRLVTKKEYFNRIVKPYLERNSQVVNHLILLNPIEKRQSGGYDAIVVAWTKIGVSDKRKKKIIKQMNNAI